MLKQKKGVANLLANLVVLVGMLISAPWVLAGAAIFLLILLGLGYFMLGKVVGFALVIGGVIAMISGKLPWYFAFPIIAVGLFLGIDPFDYQLLSIVGVPYN